MQSFLGSFMGRNHAIQFLGIVLVGCTQKASWNEIRWDGAGAPPRVSADFLIKEMPMELGSQKLTFQAQKIEDLEIEGTYYKEISTAGQTEFIGARWISKIPWSVRRDLLVMKAQRPFVLSYFFKAHEAYSPALLIHGPDLSIPLLENPQVLWKVVFESSDGCLEAVYFNSDVEIVLIKRLGSNFNEVRAQVFPEGPLRGPLRTVLLQGQFAPKDHLTSENVKISTEADILAQANDQNELRFDLGDVRFFQVQVYFYLSEALVWFEKNMSLKLPFQLEAEMQKGFPEKTNTAFYYQHKIRLGDGDGESFDKIPTDPSIVGHEAVHAVIEAVAALPYEGEGGSLNEAFADFFTASRLNNPRLGEVAYKKASFSRTLENDLRLQDANGGLYHDSGIVSGLLWSLRKQLGPEAAVRLAWQTLLRLNPRSDFRSFQQELLAVSSKENAVTQKLLQEELKKRGWSE